ncbi:MAG: hypothetical protein J7L53_03315 [Deltaproteobacteria bacterium]|nr:hypothetical protein [Deltaproteobacteria bacterium]
MIRKIVFLIIFLWTPCLAVGEMVHDVYFRGKNHELDVYRIYGKEDGPTLMIMGGIQGNEPGGYLAADLYVDMALKKGNLIVVPRANFYSILVNKRGATGDMNRKFSSVSTHDPDSEVVKKIKEIMRQTDYFLNLHDGSGFYHPEYIDDMHNPRRYGQSIIVDTDKYITPTGKELDLGSLADRVIRQVNSSIKESEYRFRLNNHRTSAPDSIHKEQRRSATFYALTHLHKPAFACETSKSIKDFRKRVVFQTMVVNAFMKEIGIVPEQPSIYIEPPRMKYALISINNANPIAIYNNQRIFVTRGDFLEVVSVVSNYKRGVIANILGLGQLNDIGQPFRIHKPTTIEIKKDMFPCGKVHIDVTSKLNHTWLITDVNNKIYALSPDEVITVEKGATIELKDLVYMGSTSHGLNVNFKGFVPNWSNNTGEDRGYKIDTSKLLGRYATQIDKTTRRYRICAMRGNNRIVSFYIDIIDATK